MSHTEKGQVSMEFMAYFGILLFIFVAFGPIIFNQTVEIRKMSADIEASRVANLIEREINSAVRFGEGYSRNFTVPHEVARQEYNMTVRSGSHGKILTVEWNEGVENRQLIVSDVEGSPTPGENLIENSDGSIIFGDSSQ